MWQWSGYTGLKKRWLPSMVRLRLFKMIPGQNYSRGRRDTNGSGRAKAERPTTLTSHPSRATNQAPKTPTFTKESDPHLPQASIPGTRLGSLLPIFLLAIILLAHLLGAVGRMAGVSGRGTHNIVACVAIGLRPLIVGLARLGRLEGRSRGTAGGGRLDGR